MNAPRWIALDIGTTGTKAALMTSAGAILGSAYRDYATHHGDGGVVEQDPRDWWQAAVEAISELAGRHGDRQPAGIAVTGQMQNLIPVGQDGAPLRAAILYSDTRARDEADEVRARVGVDRLYRLTGTEPDAGGLLAKLLWLCRHEPEVLASAGARLLLGAADFVVLGMTGAVMTDSTTASTTGLYDLHARDLLDQGIFDLLDLSAVPALLAPARPGGAPAGKLSASAADLMGLSPGIPVHLGPGDAGAVTIGVGAGEPGRVYGYLGTSGWVAATTAAAGATQGEVTLIHPGQDRYIQVAPLLTAGGNLEWVRDLFGQDDYGGLIEAASRREPSSLLYLPYLNGERAPFRDPLARGAFIGLDASTARADLYRAVLEGVAHAYRHALESLGGAGVETLVLAGGGTRSRGWCQLFADILGLPVEIAAEPEFAGARGAVVAALVASGALPDYAPPGYIPVGGRMDPDPRWREYHDRQHLRYVRAYPALKDLFRLAAVTSP